MATDNNPTHSDNPEGAKAPKPQVRCAPGIFLMPEQVGLLNQAFPGEKVILVKEEFRSGYSGATVILVTLGAGRAPLVIKFAHPHDLQQEYDAYVEFVRQVSPQNIAHLQGEPVSSEDGQLGVIQYTFAGGESHLPTNSLRAYYESAGAEDTAAVLNRIFRVYGRHWWANNHAESYVLDEHYDRLLPVHFQAKPVSLDTQADYTVRSGDSIALVTAKAQIGQTLHLVNLVVTKSRSEGRKLTLRVDPPDSEATAALRIRVEGEDPTDYRPGDVVDSKTVEITATRMSLLSEAARAALPGLDPSAKQFTLSTGDGIATDRHGIVLPNPLIKLPDQLYSVVETKMSVIHGDLNLQNVLVDMPTGFSWLIDFAETRVGPTLLDLQRLEVQVITKLMPADGDVPLASVVEMMTRLHADPPLPAPPQPELQEPYTLLATIRRLARQYLMDDLDWNEYYYGLVVALIGALKYDELDDMARKLALVCAAAADSLVGKPLQTTATGATETQLIVTAAPDGVVTPAVAVDAATPEQAVDESAAQSPGQEAVLPAAAAATAGAQRPVAPPAEPAAAAAAASRAPQPVPQQRSSGTSEPVSAPTKQRSRGAGIAIGAVALLLVALAVFWFATRSSGPETASTGADGEAAIVAATEHAAESGAGAADSGSADSGNDGADAAQAGDLAAGSAAAGVEASTDTPSPESTPSEEDSDSSSDADAASEEATQEPADTQPESTPEPDGTPGVAGTAADSIVANPGATDVPLLETVFTLNVRSGPGTAFDVVGSLEAGDIADVLGRSTVNGEEWFQIEYPEDSGEPAWITGNPSLVKVSSDEEVPSIARGDLPTPPAIAPAQAAPARASSAGQGDIYYSATVRGVDNIYRVPAAGGSPVLVVERGLQPTISTAEMLAYTSTDARAQGVTSLNLGNNRTTQFSNSPEDALPSWNGDGGAIVYASNREGDRAYRLFVTGGGGNELPLGRGADPDWHPTQDLIVYRGCDDAGGRCGLWTMASSGSSRQQLTDQGSDSRPKWSPDGRSVVFMSRRDGNWEVYSVDAAGGDVQRLTDDPANDGHPVFSPDGGSIAFLTNRSANGDWEIQTMSRDGGDLQRVVTLDGNLPDWLAHGLDWVN